MPSARPAAWVSLVACCAALCAAACAPDNSDLADCRSPTECGAAEAPCAGCPAIAEALCLEGACEARGSDAVEVVADVSLDRSIASSVASLVHVLAAGKTGAGAFSCAAAFSDAGIADDVNVLASAYKALSGGSFHPDLSLGRAPAGPVAVLLLATADSAGQGAVLGRGCVEPQEGAAGTLDLGVVEIDP